MNTITRNTYLALRLNRRQAVIPARSQNLSFKSFVSSILARTKVPFSRTDKPNNNLNPIDIDGKSEALYSGPKNQPVATRIAEHSENLKIKESQSIIESAGQYIVKPEPKLDIQAKKIQGPVIDRLSSFTDVEKHSIESQKKQNKSRRKTKSDDPVDISRLDLRVGRIIELERHKGASLLYVVKVDCGDPFGIKTIVAGLVEHVPMSELLNRLVLVICNLKPSKKKGITSEAMVLCATILDKVEIVHVPKGANPGDRVIFDNNSGKPDLMLKPKLKIWEQVSQDIKTDENGIVKYKSIPFRVDGLEGHFKSSLKNAQIK